MPTLLCHMQIKPTKINRFEEIIRALVRETRSNEPRCLRYEYWRGTSEGQYYAFLSFPDSVAFYEHQGSSYHEEYIGELREMFDSFRIEYVDPIAQGGSDLPRTVLQPLGEHAPPALRQQEALYPVSVQSWWQAP